MKQILETTRSFSSTDLCLYKYFLKAGIKYFHFCRLWGVACLGLGLV